ncbi:MAG: hypothetical protein GY754_19265 [bacterium]|nr:hypothetical protein [bacterium]
MTQVYSNKLPERAGSPVVSDRVSKPEGVEPRLTVVLDDAEIESLEVILKEIILNLPHDPYAIEEVYRSDLEDKGNSFRVLLYGYEMRALRRLLGKISGG